MNITIRLPVPRFPSALSGKTVAAHVLSIVFPGASRVKRRRSARGRLNGLALEGNPGIGKTTAVRRHLEQKSSGYRVRITRVRPEEHPDGTTQSARQAVRKLAGEALQASALAEIVRALEQGFKQVIYFAQDKLFLSDLQKALAKREDAGLDSTNVEVLYEIRPS